MALDQKPRSPHQSSDDVETEAQEEAGVGTLQQQGELMLRRLSKEGAKDTPPSFAAALARAEAYAKAKYDEVVALTNEVDQRGELRFAQVRVYVKRLSEVRSGATSTAQHTFVSVEIPGSPFDDVAGAVDGLYERLVRGIDAVCAGK